MAVIVERQLPMLPELRVIELALPAKLIAQVDEFVLAARSRGERWGRSELVALAIEEHLCHRSAKDSSAS